MILWLRIFLVLLKQCSKEVTAMFSEVWMMGPLNDYQQQQGQRNLQGSQGNISAEPHSLYSRPLQLLWLLRVIPHELLLKEVCITTGISEERAH